MPSIYSYPIYYTLKTKLQNFLYLNNVLNTLISPGFWLVNAHLRQMVPTFHNHHNICVNLDFITND